MAPQIDISDETYDRLSKRAIGFDTPEAVINRLLDQANGTRTQKPELVFSPTDEELFKRVLIKRKEAEVVLYKFDGSREIIFWNAQRFKIDSNLRANLWSGQLRGWQEKGIVKAELTVLPIPKTRDEGRDMIEQQQVAKALKLTYVEIAQLVYEIEVDNENFHFIIQFDSDCPQEILAKIENLHTSTISGDEQYYVLVEFDDIDPDERETELDKFY